MNVKLELSETCRILVVDDERYIAEMVRVNLEASGYEACVAGNGRQALAKYDQVHPDLVVLDLMLPDTSGFDILARLRRFSRVPVIILTVKGDPNDAAKGLELGADDYVTKPFHIRELLARVSAVLRRSRGEVADVLPEGADGTYDDGHLSLDASRWKVTLAGETLQLTPKEFSVLSLLVANRDRVVGHDEILARVWGPEHVGDRHYLRVVVARLRQRLGGDEDYIATVPWVGYQFRADKQAGGSGDDEEVE